MRYVNRITDLKIATSYFALVTGLSGVAFIPIFFTLIATGGFIAAKILKSRITAEVLKEEYGEKQTSNDISDVFDE